MSSYQPPIEIMQRCSPLLQEELSYDDAAKLRQQLAACEAVRHDLAYTRCEWWGKLVAERERARLPKDKEYTDFDRKTFLQANTSVVESDYQFLLELEDIIKQRIELGISFLQDI